MSDNEKNNNTYLSCLPLSNFKNDKIKFFKLGENLALDLNTPDNDISDAKDRNNEKNANCAKTSKKSQKNPPNTNRFTSDEDTLLITLIQKKPAIWDFTLHMKYRTEAIKNQNWCDILQSFPGKL